MYKTKIEPYGMYIYLAGKLIAFCGRPQKGH